MELPIRIIPVLDVLHGITVRGVAGNRAEYRPLVSRWCESADPIAVAEAIRRNFGFVTLYLADLDAILGKPPAQSLYARLHSLGFQLWVDAGIRTAEDALRLVEANTGASSSIVKTSHRSPLSPACNDFTIPKNLEGAGEGMGGFCVPRTPLTPAPLPPPATVFREAKVAEGGGRGESPTAVAMTPASKNLTRTIAVLVLGLETIANASELVRIVRDLGSERVAFSIDLKNGQPMGNWGDSPMAIADEVIEAGVKRLIVLDLSRVGMGQGTGTEQLLTDLSRRHPEVELIAGGGVRGPQDLERLRACGAAAALVASALHDGRLL